MDDPSLPPNIEAPAPEVGGQPRRRPPQAGSPKNRNIPMPDNVAHTGHAADEPIQRTILQQLLREDHYGPWARSEIEHALGHIPAWTVNDAIAALAERGLAEVSGEAVLASDAARNLRLAD
jgi:hypothetical protein